MIVSSAELPPMTSERCRACFWIRQDEDADPREDQHVEEQGRRGEGHVVEHDGGDDEAGGVGDDVDGEPREEPPRQDHPPAGAVRPHPKRVDARP